MSNKKILIVSLKAGAGHIKAAEAMENALKRTFPAYTIINVDLLDYMTVLSKEFYGQWYLDLVNSVPQFYKWLYDHIDASAKDIRLLSDRINAQKFKQFMIETNPDLVVCTHFLPADLITHWGSSQKIPPTKTLVTLTDYEAHPMWYNEDVNLFTVATDDVKKQMISYGVDTKKVFTTGIPIDPKFSQKHSLVALRKKNNLTNQFTVGLFAGGFGVGHVEDVLREILTLPPNFQIIAVAGKNHALYNRLKSVSSKSKHHTLVIPFTDKIEEIMTLSNIIISKSGGLTVSETLAVGTPLIIQNPIPGQEEANSDYLTSHLSALRADTPSEIVKTLHILINYPTVIDSLKKEVSKLAKPDAAFTIARLCKNLL